MPLLAEGGAEGAGVPLPAEPGAAAAAPAHRSVSVALPTPFRDAALAAPDSSLSPAVPSGRPPLHPGPPGPLPKRRGGVLRDKYGEMRCIRRWRLEHLLLGSAEALASCFPGWQWAAVHASPAARPGPLCTALPTILTTRHPRNLARCFRPVPHAVRPARPNNGAGERGRRAGALQRADAAGAVQGALGSALGAAGQAAAARVHPAQPGVTSLLDSPRGHPAHCLQEQSLAGACP